MNSTSQKLTCYHCGESCKSHKLDIGEKSFCCNGCRSVYLLLNQHELGNYYCLNEKPGTTMKAVQPEKFRFLDDDTIAGRLLEFSNGRKANVTFYLPQIHCSSCLWLLEHLDQVHPGIITSRVQFAAKELWLSFDLTQLSLRQLAELLTRIGYEPHISLQESRETAKATRYSSKNAAYKLGITGFCFANIMLISFPEYLGLKPEDNSSLTAFFRWVNLGLSLPVVFYGAREFFKNAFYSFRQGYVNIDAPIALAITITFLRSIYEITSGTGAGYLDSMSGIVFFMLLGRTLQNRTYSTLSFNRDYKSYFPIAVTVLKGGKKQTVKIQDVREQDILLLHHQEIIPVDGILSKGKAAIDYSFITGESLPEAPVIGDLVYAGGKVAGSAIEVIVVKDFKQNSFTRLWNNKAFKQQHSDKETMTTTISKYFSLTVIAIALAAFLYWQFAAPQHAWNALTAVLIVACPCALLLTTTFTNGYLIEYFAAHGFFLRDAQVIEYLANANHIAFDKTGTITEAQDNSITATKMTLTQDEKEHMLAVLSQSIHPLAKAITAHYRYTGTVTTNHIKEIPGKGMEAWIEDHYYKIGSAAFTGVSVSNITDRTEVYVTIDGALKAHFLFRHHVKEGIPALLQQVPEYTLSMVSGDNDNSHAQLRKLFPPDARFLFRQSPQQKLEHIQDLQQQGKKVIMVGDGLNDAGALQQSDAGIAVVQHSFAFSPACEAILEADKLPQLPAFLKMAKASQRLILYGFAYSVLFNIVGVGFAVSAHLSPMVAAILMPSSSLGIMLIAFAGIKGITRNQPENEADISMTKR